MNRLLQVFSVLVLVAYATPLRAQPSEQPSEHPSEHPPEEPKAVPDLRAPGSAVTEPNPTNNQPSQPKASEPKEIAAEQATDEAMSESELETSTNGSDDIEPDESEQEAKPKAVSLEKPSPHQGHYIALGFHATGATANDPDRGRRGPAFGTGFSLRLGERITKRLDLGLGLAYARVGGSDPWTFGRLTVHAQGYLTEKTYVHAGFGFGAAGGTDPEDPDFSRGRFGDVYTAGAGHNFYLSDNKKSGGWIVSPVVTAEYGRDDKFPNAGLWIGVEISRWWGIPRNQLDLDFDEAYKRR